jgi:hypothetical protein
VDIFRQVGPIACHQCTGVVFGKPTGSGSASTGVQACAEAICLRVSVGHETVTVQTASGSL